MKNYFVETEGTITESLSDGTFGVKLDHNDQVLCELSRRMQKNYIPVDVGDRVTVSLTSHNATRGCIAQRVAYSH